MTIPDPSDTLGDPVVEQTVRKLIETAGRLVAYRNLRISWITTVMDFGGAAIAQLFWMVELMNPGESLT